MPGNFRASPEYLHQARKPGIIVQSRIFFKNKTNYLIFMGVEIRPIWPKRVQILSEIVFHDTK